MASSFVVRLNSLPSFYLLPSPTTRPTLTLFEWPLLSPDLYPSSITQAIWSSRAFWNRTLTCQWKPSVSPQRTGETRKPDGADSRFSAIVLFSRQSLVLCPQWTLGRYVYIKQTRMAYEEAANMEFIRRSTSIPVPRVIFALRVPAWVFWWYRKWYWGKTVPYSSEPYIFILNQVRTFISELRDLQPPPSATIGSVNGGPVVDDRLAQGWSPQSIDCEICGPYVDEAEMNLVLRRQLPLSDFPSSIVESHRRSHPLVFTHGDIDMRNIMVDGDKVVALIDWETSGWFPAHWEYLKAHWVPIVQEGEYLWRNCIAEIIPAYEFERKADHDLIGHLLQNEQEGIYS